MASSSATSPTVAAVGHVPRAPGWFPPRPARVPLSYAQQRLWFLDQFEGGSPEYNMPQALRLRGTLNRDALEHAINAMVARHESLRTRFAVAGGEPCQVVESSRLIPLAEEDIRQASADEQGRRVRAAIRREWCEPFDLANGPVLRTRLLRLADEESVLLLTLHHIASDAWSNAIVNTELSTLYAEACAGSETRLPPLPAQYAEFATWQRQWLDGGGLDRGVEYWAQQLNGMPDTLSLPFDRPRPPVRTSDAEARELQIPAGLAAAVARLARRTRATPYMTLLAAFGALLFRYSGQHDFGISAPIANRRDTRLEGLIGFFVNTIVVRMRIDRAMSFESLLRQVRATALEAYRHQDVPFDRVVEAVAPPRVLNRPPLAHVAFAFQNTPKRGVTLEGLDVEAVTGADQRVRADLEVHGYEGRDGLSLTWLFNSALFDRWRIEQMAADYHSLLEAVTANPQRAIGHVPLMPAPPVPEPPIATPSSTLPELIEEQVGRTPDAVALVCGEHSVTFAGLNARANRLAHELVHRGVGREDVVALAFERSVEMMVALLAIMKAGGAYLPLDMAYPADRLAFMVADAKPALVLTGTPAFARRMPVAAPVLDLRKVWRSAARRLAANPARPLTPTARRHHAAYVIYTSGSTGTPKGTVVANAGIERLVSAQIARFAVGPGSRVLQFASLSFDAAFSEFAIAWASGATLVVVTPAERELDGLPGAIARHGVTHAKLPPSAASVLDDETLGRLELLVFGGELCPPELVRRRAPAGRVINAYGPTESTVCAAMSGQLSGLDAVTPIGRTVPDTHAHVLDTGLEPVPLGVEGELYLSGAGLARGYLGRPGLTAARFVASPWGTHGARMYRTGDRARQRRDGQLECFGRTDAQMKVRGYRIEPGEIEAALRRDERVREAVVVARGEREHARLVAYVVSQRGHAAPGRPRTALSRELRSHLQRLLPDYLVPAAIVVLEGLPLTPNGKLDYQALPAPEGDRREGERRSLWTPREAAISQVFAEVVGVETVDADDDFFALGGHSLLAARLVARLRTVLETELTIRNLFEAPTPALLAARLDNLERGASPLSAMEVLRPRASLPPIICLPPGGGLGWGYAGLLGALEHDRPLCCLQAPSLYDGSPFPATVAESAEQYLSHIRQHQPVGPYYLLGWSFGGLVAHEIAWRLQQDAHRVAFLGILDAFPDAKYGRLTTRRQREVEQYYAELEKNRPPGLSVDHIDRMRELTVQSFAAARASRPNCVTGDLLLVTAAGHWSRRRSWRPFVSGHIVAHEVSCHHDEMLRPANLRLVGQLVSRQIARVDGLSAGS